MEADDRAITRVAWAFNVSFPPIFFLCLVYSCLGKPVFAINRVVGDRLHGKLRRGLRLGYILSCSLAAGSLHVGTLWYGVPALFDPCMDQVLGKRAPVFTMACAAIWYVVITFADRIAVPLLNIPSRTPGHAHDFTERMLESCAITSIWMAFGDRSTAVVPLMLGITGRRMLAAFPMFAWAYVLILKTIAFHHTTLALNPGCGDSVPKGPTVAMLLNVFLL
mgnify:CR=1 FL=1